MVATFGKESVSNINRFEGEIKIQKAPTGKFRSEDYTEYLIVQSVYTHPKKMNDLLRCGTAPLNTTVQFCSLLPVPKSKSTLWHSSKL